MAGEARRRRLRELLDLAGLPSGEIGAIDAAFVHQSAAAEERVPSNERLEFLGDAVLGLLVSRWLYAAYPDEPEGVLTKRKAAIVNGRALAKSARRLGFSDLIRVGAGERAHGGAERASTLADVFEAFLATLYLQFGLDAAAGFLERRHLAFVDHDRAAVADSKTQLQELTQARVARMPVYEERSEGPAHRRTFTSVVRVEGEVVGTGTGATKKAAQQDAASAALIILRKRYETQAN